MRIHSAYVNIYWLCCATFFLVRGWEGSINEVEVTMGPAPVSFNGHSISIAGAGQVTDDSAPGRGTNRQEATWP